ncbi:hypothetical protein PINS_up020471 [Pythium insidiosum]|nr:hypothetical protein PINS_up020471 [Pythium insidiosum]
MATTTASVGASDAALRVVTEPMLWPQIISFLPGTPVWTIEYEQRFEPKNMLPLAVAEKASEEAKRLKEQQDAKKKSTVGSDGQFG